MARNLKQIEQSIASDIEQIDPTLDTTKGPIPDIFIRPQAAVIRLTELRIDDLNKRYSLDYIKTTNTASLELYGANHGVRKSPGKPATGHVYFFTFTRLNPDETITLPAGIIVSTSDDSLSFQTTTSVSIQGSAIDSYFNASRRRYEVRAPITSLGTGDAFEVPAGRIRLVKSAATGIDGVENREPTKGSRAAESNEAFGRHIQAKFNGTALGSGDGLKQLILNFDTSRILDVKLIFSSDYTLFRRRTRRAAWDVYLIGEDSFDFTDTFSGDGTTREFVLSKQPVLSVNNVTVNGLLVPYSFVRDTSDQTRLSSRATDKIVFASAPSTSDVIEVNYNFDRLIVDTQEYVDNLQVKLYDADTLVRKAIPVVIGIGVNIQVLGSFDESQAVTDTYSSISDFTDIETYVSILYPERLRDKISAEVGGISDVRITQFTRLDSGTLPVESVEFLAYEYPVTEAANISITVRR